MRRLQHLGLALMAIASPAIAQPAPAAAPDPARLAVARDVVALAMPPVVSAAMVGRMVQGSVPVMRQIFLRDPQLQAFYAADPRVKSIFDRSVSEVEPRTQASRNAEIAEIKALPALNPKSRTP